MVKILLSVCAFFANAATCPATQAAPVPARPAAPETETSEKRSGQATRAELLQHHAERNSRSTTNTTKASKTEPPSSYRWAESNFKAEYSSVLEDSIGDVAMARTAPMTSMTLAEDMDGPSMNRHSETPKPSEKTTHTVSAWEAHATNASPPASSDLKESSSEKSDPPIKRYDPLIPSGATTRHTTESPESSRSRPVSRQYVTQVPLATMATATSTAKEEDEALSEAVAPKSKSNTGTAVERTDDNGMMLARVSAQSAAVINVSDAMAALASQDDIQDVTNRSGGMLEILVGTHNLVAFCIGLFLLVSMVAGTTACWGEVEKLSCRATG